MPRKNSRKTKKKKVTRKSRSFTGLIFLGSFRAGAKLFKGVGRLLVWLIIMAWRGTKKNPLAALGLCCFMLILAFVGVNALFYNHAPLASSARPIPDLRMIEVQDELAEIGLYDGEIDGLSGIKTQAAVENWQKLRRALEKGKAGITGNGSQEPEDALARIIRQTQE